MAQLKQKLYAIVVLAPVPAKQMTPGWLLKHSLIRPDEAEAAIVKHRTDELSVFSIGPIEVFANGERLQVATADAGAVLQAFDLTSNVFSVLKSSFVRAVGFNVSSHFDVASKAEWHRIGHKMAPKEPWRPILGKNPGVSQYACKMSV